MPTLTRRPGTGARPTYPSRNRIIRASRGLDGPGSATWNVRPTRSAEKRRAADAERPGHRRADPVGTDDHSGVQCGLAIRATSHDPAAFHPGDRRPEPDVRSGAAREVEQRRVESGPIEADRRSGERAVVAVRKPKLRSGCRLDAHRRRRPNHRRKRLRVEPGLAKRIDRGRRAEDTAGAPSIPRRPLEEDDRASTPRQSRGEDRPGRAAADDRDVGGHARIAAIE